MGIVDPFPGLDGTRFPVRQNELSAFVLPDVDKDFHLVSYLQVGIVAEFVQGDNPFRLRIDIDDRLPVGKVGYGTFHDLGIGGIHKVLCHEILKFLELVVFDALNAFLVLFPVEIFEEFLWISFFNRLFCLNCCRCGFLHLGYFFFFSHLLIFVCIPKYFKS